MEKYEHANLVKSNDWFITLFPVLNTIVIICIIIALNYDAKHFKITQK